MSAATEPSVVAEQARMVAVAWSPPDAPPSWRLTAEQFETLGEDDELLAIAATIDPARLPALLFEPIPRAWCAGTPATSCRPCSSRSRTGR